MMESVASGMLASVSDTRDMVPRWVGERWTSTDSGVVIPSLDKFATPKEASKLDAAGGGSRWKGGKCRNFHFGPIFISKKIRNRSEI